MYSLINKWMHFVLWINQSKTYFWNMVDSYA